MLDKTLEKIEDFVNALKSVQERKQFRRKIERRKAQDGVTTRHDDKGYIPKRIRKGKDKENA